MRKIEIDNLLSLVYSFFLGCSHFHGKTFPVGEEVKIVSPLETKTKAFTVTKTESLFASMN